MHEIWHSGLVHWDDFKGWDGEGGGKGAQDVAGREVAGGFRMGNTWTALADSCQCMAKPSTIL